jgi:hypothetical protein
MYLFMYVCMYVYMHVCMYACMYVCNLHFLWLNIGSLVSVGVGPWYCKQKGPGSNLQCVRKSFVQVLFSWGGGGGG